MRRATVGSLDFADIRTEFHLADTYPADAENEARTAVDAHAGGRRDARDIEFVTIDPPGSMDLDQALHVARDGGGFVLSYAIADVGALVVPGGALDMESRRRGQTVYLPDGSVPLHPRPLSEGSASLLPDQDRPVALWTIAVGADGEPTAWTVERATVRSRRRFTYADVQADVDAGRVHPSLEPLQDLGVLRMARAVARGAIELSVPEQDVVRDGDHWRVDLAARTAADDWNAEMSLLTGMCAAHIMVEAKVGILRTLPPAASADVAELRRSARVLGVRWPDGAAPGVVLASLPANEPATLAVMTEATRLLRGASYLCFNGQVSDHLEHAGIGGIYAHVTAPLRRLVDRFATEICLAVVAGQSVPSWVTEAFGSLPEIMRQSDSLANKVDRACIDLTEATWLAENPERSFEAVVLAPAHAGRSPRLARVFVSGPDVIAECTGSPAEGTRITVRVRVADPATRTVLFEPM